MTPKERMALPPQEMPQQDPAVRAHNMNEVALGYTAEMAQREATRCLQCPTKPCMQGCPVAINRKILQKKQRRNLVYQKSVDKQKRHR